MKRLDIPRAMLSALIAWTIGVTAYVTSFFIPVMSDQEAQANLVLLIALIPAAAIGARFYFVKGSATSGLLLGTFMFINTIILDAVITVPVFIYPTGGNHYTFFGDMGFWLLGLEYVIVVTIYSKLRTTYGRQDIKLKT
ncbi:MAG: DUF5367 family protein [Bacteroidota bacterium]